MKEVRNLQNGTGFRVTTSEGIIEANNVVAATGPFQQPVIPTLIPNDIGIYQIHSQHYRNPEQLPGGSTSCWSWIFWITNCRRIIADRKTSVFIGWATR